MRLLLLLCFFAGTAAAAVASTAKTCSDSQSLNHHHRPTDCCVLEWESFILYPSLRNPARCFLWHGMMAMKTIYKDQTRTIGSKVALHAAAGRDWKVSVPKYCAEKERKVVSKRESSEESFEIILFVPIRGNFRFEWIAGLGMKKRGEVKVVKSLSRKFLNIFMKLITRRRVRRRKSL